MPDPGQEMAGGGNGVRLQLRPEHPSVALYDAMDKDLWEGLGAAASDGVLCRATPPAVHARLVEMGLLFDTGLPTASGYALLLRWHRDFRVRERLRRWWGPSPTRHEHRMRHMWSC